MRIVSLLVITFVRWATAQNYGDLRLVQNGDSSSSNTHGRLEIYYSGRWGTVCDNSWSRASTRVACRQLGFFTTSTNWTTSSTVGYGSATGRIWLDNVRCSGSEYRLTNCPRSSFGVHDCRHYEDVAIDCNIHSTRSGDLRLVQSGSTSSFNTRGRLEVYYSGRWGTVCDDVWSSTNTRVACRQLGFSTASTSWTTSSAGGYGTGTGRIWLDNVRCSGSESKLISCQRNYFGSHDCNHSEDVAIDCISPRFGDLRLVQNGNSSSSNTRGRLEVYSSGQWGTVCNDLWSSANTRVACRQLGLPTYKTSWTTSSAAGYGTGTGRIWLDNVRCSGFESRLIYCQRNNFGYHDCNHSEDVAIECNAPRSGDLRLVRNGNSNSSYTHGRLEVYYSGVWGTVCDDYWSTANTRVACRQLGLSTASTSWTTSSAGGYGSATGSIWLDNVRCSGSESRLTNCPRSSFGSHNCFHSKDVAIDCNYTPALISGDLRLVQNRTTSSSNTRGRLEVYYSGRWGTVCHDSWSSTNTRVACRQLGFFALNTSWTTSSAGGYGTTTGRIWLDNVRCSGSESRLTNCPKNSYGSHNCFHSQDVAIDCNVTGLDSATLIHPRSGDLRLVQNGNSSSSNTRGRLEVYYSGQWGTVCDDYWSSTNTRVACRQLGFLPTSNTSWTTSSAGGYGSATGRIWLDNVRCSGSEETLTSCQRRFFGYHSCSHSEDVAIDCRPGVDTVAIAVGVSVSSLVLFVIIPTICIIIVCIMRRRRTPTQTAAHATSVTPRFQQQNDQQHNAQWQNGQQPTAQQLDFQAYPAAGTDLKQAPPPAYEMHTAYPAPSHQQSKQAPPPPYEIQATPSPSYLTTSSQQQSEQPQPPPYEIPPHCASYTVSPTPG